MNRRLTGLIISTLVLGLLLVYPTRAYACSCGEARSAEEARDAAQAVFAGTVLLITPIEREDHFHSQRVTFYVSSVWKGPATLQHIVETGSGGGDCGYPFLIGESYLVYATEWEGQLGTSICQRTDQLEDAQEDMVALGPAQEGSLRSSPLLLFACLVAGVIGSVVVLGLALVLHAQQRNSHATPK